MLYFEHVTEAWLRYIIYVVLPISLLQQGYRTLQSHLFDMRQPTDNYLPQVFSMPEIFLWFGWMQHLVVHFSIPSWSWRKGSWFPQRRWWEWPRYTRSLKAWTNMSVKVLRCVLQCHISELLSICESWRIKYISYFPVTIYSGDPLVTIIWCAMDSLKTIILLTIIKCSWSYTLYSHNTFLETNAYHTVCLNPFLPFGINLLDRKGK